MTNEDMLYRPVWEEILEQLLSNSWSPIEEAALVWAGRKVSEHAELYDAVVSQTQEIEQLNDFIEEVERERDIAIGEADDLQDELNNANDYIAELENELEAAREPKID